MSAWVIKRKYVWFISPYVNKNAPVTRQCPTPAAWLPSGGKHGPQRNPGLDITMEHTQAPHHPVPFAPLTHHSRQHTASFTLGETRKQLSTRYRQTIKGKNNQQSYITNNSRTNSYRSLTGKSLPKLLQGFYSNIIWFAGFTAIISKGFYFPQTCIIALKQILLRSPRWEGKTEKKLLKVTDNHIQELACTFSVTFP